MTQLTPISSPASVTAPSIRGLPNTDRLHANSRRTASTAAQKSRVHRMRWAKISHQESRIPLYFHLLAPAGAWEILAHRILWTLLFCAAVLAVRREFAWSRSVFGNPRMLGAVTLAGLLIGVNWVIYVGAVVAHHVTEASLGYFLNPIVTVAIGVIVLRERLRTLQWLAVAIGLAAGVYLTIDFGRPPWIALSLAFSFALYGLMKKRLGTSLGAFQSLTSETAVLAPIALVILVWLGTRGETTFTGSSPSHPLLLASAGVVTAVPLLLFAAAGTN